MGQVANLRRVANPPGRLRMSRAAPVNNRRAGNALLPAFGGESHQIDHLGERRFRDFAFRAFTLRLVEDLRLTPFPTHIDRREIRIAYDEGLALRKPLA